MRTAFITLATTALIASASLAHAQPGEQPMTTQAAAPQSSPNDFDFLMGDWRVHHRRLKERLAGNHEWIEFEGTLSARKTMGGAGNVDDNVLEMPGGAYRAVGLRAFDPKTRLWAIWWLDGRMPEAPLDPPVRGSFESGVGTFYADDTFKGKQIRMRFQWSRITSTTCHWEQAFSPDGGNTWETNWTMDFARVS